MSSRGNAGMILFCNITVTTKISPYRNKWSKGRGGIVGGKNSRYVYDRSAVWINQTVGNRPALVMDRLELFLQSYHYRLRNLTEDWQRRSPMPVGQSNRINLFCNLSVVRRLSISWRRNSRIIPSSMGRYKIAFSFGRFYQLIPNYVTDLQRDFYMLACD